MWAQLCAAVALCALSCGHAVAQPSTDAVRQQGVVVQHDKFQAAYAQWRRLSQSEVNCVDQALRGRGSNLWTWIQRGVMPNDSSVAAMRTACKTQQAKAPSHPSTDHNAGQALAASTETKPSTAEKVGTDKPADKAATDRAAAEKQAVAEKAEAARITAEKNASDKAAAARAAAEKVAAAEKAETAKIAAERAAAGKLAFEHPAPIEDKVIADKAAADKATDEKASADRAAAEKAAAAASEKATAKASAEKSATEKTAAAKAAAEKAAAEIAAVAKAAAEKAAAAREAAAERAALDAARAETERAKADAVRTQAETEHPKQEAEHPSTDVTMAKVAAESRTSFLYGLASGPVLIGLGGFVFLMFGWLKRASERRLYMPGLGGSAHSDEEFYRLVEAVLAEQKRRDKQRTGMTFTPAAEKRADEAVH